MNGGEVGRRLGLLLTELSEGEESGFEFLPREGMIIILQWGKDKKLHTLGAVVEGDETTPHGWWFNPDILKPPT